MKTYLHRSNQMARHHQFTRSKLGVLSDYSGILCTTDDSEENVHNNPSNFKEFGLSSTLNGDQSLFNWFSDHLNRIYIDLFRTDQRLPKTYAILDAHGFEWENQWCYTDKDQSKRVQDWVDVFDGQVTIIIVYSCNPNKNTLSTKRSLLLYSSREVGFNPGYDYMNSWNLYQPFGKELDSYTIEYEIKQMLLQSILKRRP